MLNFEIVTRYNRQVALAVILDEFLGIYKPSRFTLQGKSYVSDTRDGHIKWLKGCGHTLISHHDNVIGETVWYYDPMPPTLEQMPEWVKVLPSHQRKVVMEQIIDDIGFRRVIVSANESTQAKYKAILDGDVNLGWILHKEREAPEKDRSSNQSRPTQWEQLTLA